MLATPPDHRHHLVLAVADVILADMETSPPSPLVTIDSNCFEQTFATATSVVELRNLIRYALPGLIRIAVTTKVEVEVDFA